MMINSYVKVFSELNIKICTLRFISFNRVTIYKIIIHSITITITKTITPTTTTTTAMVTTTTITTSSTTTTTYHYHDQNQAKSPQKFGCQSLATGTGRPHDANRLLSSPS